MAGAVLALRQFFQGGGFGVDVRHGLVNRVNGAVLLNQRRGGLFAHAGHAGNVVRRVAHQRLQINHMNGVEAVFLPERVGGHVLRQRLAHAGGYQLHLGVFRNQLQRVLVSRGSHAVPARSLAPAGDGADEVVGLPALQLVAGDVQRVQHLFHHRDLHPQLLRHGLAGGLVGRVGLVAEGGGVEVEGDAQGVGILVVFQAQQRGEKAVNGVGVKPVPGGQGADAVVRAVQNAVSVNDHQLHRRVPPQISS
jgi:hypothetical protein